MSDWRECELERIGGTIVEHAMRPGDAVVAQIGAWLVRWDYEVGVHAARVEDFDRWATVDVRCVPAATGDDVQRLLAELDEAGS